MSIRQISIKALKQNLCNELKNLPFEITRYGKVVGVVNKGSHPSKEKVATTLKGSHNKEEKVVTTEGKLPKSQKSGHKGDWKNPLNNSALAPKK